MGFVAQGNPQGYTGWIEDDVPMEVVDIEEDRSRDSDMGETTFESEMEDYTRVLSIRLVAVFFCYGACKI